MTRRYVTCIAGLPLDLFREAQAMSAKRFSPAGHLIMKPLREGSYTPEMAYRYIGEAEAWVREQQESQPVSVILLYVNYSGGKTVDFVERFFPFALSVPVPPIDLSFATSARELNRRRKLFLEGLVAAATDARRRADAVSHFIKDHHKTAALLPIRNFASNELEPLLKDAFRLVGAASDVAPALASTLSDFEKRHETRGKSNEKRCFSDGSLLFESPGRDRHGFFRHNAKGHQPGCLLSARSRLGGSYAFDFHFDCQPTRFLRATYPNCHAEQTKPRHTHVNIAPNDFVVGGKKKSAT